MSAFASQFAVGLRQVISQTGLPAIYVQLDGTLIPVTVSTANMPYVVEGLTRITIPAQERDFHVIASDLGVVPERGEHIAVRRNNVTEVYEVAIPNDKDYCWQWADRFQLRMTIHTKLVADELSDYALPAHMLIASGLTE